MATGIRRKFIHHVGNLLLLLAAGNIGHAQSPTKEAGNFSIGIQGYAGAFLLSKSKAEYVRDSYSTLGEIYFQKQTNGKRDWELSHRLPKWGISYLYGNTGSRQYIGKLHSLSAFITTPLIVKENYQLGFRLGAGPGWVTKPFDIYKNPKNTLIGTRLNAYILMLLQNEFSFSRFHVNAGISFIHVSNGGTTLPNLGLNTPAVSLGLRYSMHDDKKPVLTPIDTFTSSFQYKLFLTAGVKQAPWIGSGHYLINTLQAEASKRVAINHAWGAGIIAYYNRSLEYDPLETPAARTKHKKTQLGAYGSYEHFFGRLSIPLQAGIYLYNRARFPLLFQQFGFRVAVNDHLNTAVMLKIHSGQADFIHAGIGYTF